MLNFRRQLMGIACNQSPPITFVNYLEATGVQYINLNIPMKSSYKIELEMLEMGNKGCYLFGASDGTYALRLYNYEFRNGNSRFCSYLYYTAVSIGASNYFPYWFSPTDGTPFNILCDKNVITVKSHNDIGITKTSTKTMNTISEWSSPKEMYLFACNNPTNIVYSRNHKISYFRLWDNDTLILDLQPALSSGNKPCMYNKVDGTCFYNQGTGADFLYG